MSAIAAAPQSRLEPRMPKSQKGATVRQTLDLP